MLLVGVNTLWVSTVKSTTSTGLANQSTNTAQRPLQTLSQSSSQTPKYPKRGRISECNPSSAVPTPSSTPWWWIWEVHSAISCCVVARNCSKLQPA